MESLDRARYSVTKQGLLPLNPILFLYQEECDLGGSIVYRLNQDKNTLMMKFKYEVRLTCTGNLGPLKIIDDYNE